MCSETVWNKCPRVKRRLGQEGFHEEADGCSRGTHGERTRAEMPPTINYKCQLNTRNKHPPRFDFFPEPWTAAPPDTAENQSTAVTDVNSPRSDIFGPVCSVCDVCHLSQPARTFLSPEECERGAWRGAEEGKRGSTRA
ncbi:hypothetical protein F2P81_022141 [Scophthalmus maximus]|uniref:Uncharacterized protein n=1 Tax=Scophthalmus maximus TaxID=52904 RepID=A0A6A4S0V1_SCOMX|nr:hypothetical protein F2P81_022141 [Scophthalmus maximus]